MFKTKAMLLPLALVIFALVYGFVYLDAKTIESGYVNQILSTQHVHGNICNMALLLRNCSLGCHPPQHIENFNHVIVDKC